MFQTDRRMKSADREQVDEIEIHILELQDKRQRHEWLEHGKVEEEEDKQIICNNVTNVTIKLLR